MQKPPETFFNVEDFTPELRQVFRPPFNPCKTVLAAIPVKNPQEHRGLLPAGTERRSISLTDGTEFWFWEPDSLQSLFRGDRQPPVLGDYPEAYNDSFVLIDLHTLEISKFFGDRRDAELREYLFGFAAAAAWDSSMITSGRRRH